MSGRLEIDPEDLLDREAPPPRRRVLTPLLLVLILAGVVGGSWWFYQNRRPALAPANVPVIHSDSAPVKEAPKNPGGMVVPDQDSALLNRDGRNRPKVEQLLPPPEPVLPRPAPPPKPASVEPPAPSPTAAVPEPAATSAPPSRPEAPANAAVLPVTPSPATSVTAAAPVASPAPDPAVAAASPLASAAAPRAVSGASYRLQLGAVRSEEAARAEWQRLQKAQPDVLGKLGLNVARVELGEKGVFYRIQAGPVGDAAEAAQSCATLKSRNVGCILVKP